MSHPLPILSLIVATLDDAGDLSFCLQSLAAQVDPPPFEVIVVDQNGDDRLKTVIAQFSGQLALRWERVGFRNASRARNRGAGLARGRWLGFPDDDCRLLPDALAVAAPLLSRPDLAILSGRTVDAAGRSNILRWKSEAGAFVPATAFGRMTGATLFVRRDVFADAGGYDPDFGPGARYPAAEEFDLVSRIFESMDEGLAWYEPGIRMQHPDAVPPWTSQSARRFRTYGIGAGAWAARHFQPYLALWLMRTLVASTLQMISLPPWRSASYGMRILGVLEGLCRYSLDRRKASHARP